MPEIRKGRAFDAMRGLLDACWNANGSASGTTAIGSQASPPDASAIENLNPFSLAACDATREQFVELAALVKHAANILEEFRKQREYPDFTTSLLLIFLFSLIFCFFCFCF